MRIGGPSLPRYPAVYGHTHPTFAELFGDAVVRDGLADHDGPILPQRIDGGNNRCHEQTDFFRPGRCVRSVSGSVRGGEDAYPPD